jgi:hypothetical protein
VLQYQKAYQCFRSGQLVISKFSVPLIVLPSLAKHSPILRGYIATTSESLSKSFPVQATAYQSLFTQIDNPGRLATLPVPDRSDS